MKKTAMALVVAAGLLAGCEADELLNLSNEKPQESEDQISGLVDGAVVIEAGHNAQIQKVDTIDDPVKITAGDNAVIGPINTGGPNEEDADVDDAKARAN